VIPISTIQLRHAALGVTYPAERWELLAFAEYNGACANLLSSLQRLPVVQYHSVSHIVDSLRSSGINVVHEINVTKEIVTGRRI
jgi:Protein of unknown function (DUF2795)